MLLLDTCTLLWLALDQTQLSVKSRETMAKQADKLFVSAISAFEIAIKYSKKQLRLPLVADLWFEKICIHHGICILPINAAIASRSALLPKLHFDPCDRFIIATAQFHHMILLTPDNTIKTYPRLKVVW